MVTINFSNFEYVPALGTTDVENIVYQRLTQYTREGILPLFELNRRRGASDFSSNADMLSETVNHPFLLDIDKRVAPAPYQAQAPANPIQEAARIERETAEINAFNSNLNALLSPADGFENWRQFVSQFPMAVPVLQYTNPLGQSNAIIRQASLLSLNGASIAMRITPNQSDILCDLAVQIISALPSSSQILLIFDCGQGRVRISERASWAANSYQSILSELEVAHTAHLSAVCMSNSYPQPQGSGLIFIENRDRELWSEATDSYPFLFGDYAANHRPNTLSSFVPRNYRATVVHSQDNRWIVHRHENSDDPNGWHIGCEAIIQSGEFNPLPSWTDEIIQSVATNGLGEMTLSRQWHAARICGHIERQFSYTQYYDDDFEDILG